MGDVSRIEHADQSHVHADRRAQRRPPMIAPTLAKYLDQNVTYNVVLHEPTASSMRTAEACHISGDCLAKAVVLRHDGSFLLAVLPASHRIDLPELRAE